MDVLNKHDNPTLAGIYRRKYEREAVDGAEILDTKPEDL